MNRQTTGPSIKDALAGKMGKDTISVKEQHTMYTHSEESSDFTPDELGERWNKFLERLNDRPNLKSTLSRLPHLEADCKLVLEIDNSVQEDLINIIKPELVAWLRRELKNSTIQLVTRISEVKTEKIIYTDLEKYAEMLKKNPKLDLLKQKFKLDFE